MSEPTACAVMRPLLTMLTLSPQPNRFHFNGSSFHRHHFFTQHNDAGRVIDSDNNPQLNAKRRFKWHERFDVCGYCRSERRGIFSFRVCHFSLSCISNSDSQRFFRSPSIVAVILGCVISALFCLAVIILGFWLLRSRRRRRADRQSESDRRQFIDLVSDGSDVSEPKLGTSVAPPATPTLLRMPPPAPASYTPSYYAYSTTSRPPAYPLSIHPPSTAGLADAGHSPDRLPYVETESNRTFNDDHRRQMMERRISGHPFAMAPNEMERMMRKDRDIKRHWI